MPVDVDCLIDADAIRSRVEALAAEIAPRLAPDPLVIGLLLGAFTFTADLIRALSVLGVEPGLDFMTLSSYGEATASSGRVRVRMDCRTPLEGRQVLIVDTVLDSGVTLRFARDHLHDRGAREVLSCVLLDKATTRRQPVTTDFVGFAIPDLFVVGYGVDAAGRFRELPYIGHVGHG